MEAGENKRKLAPLNLTATAQKKARKWEEREQKTSGMKEEGKKMERRMENKG